MVLPELPNNFFDGVVLPPPTLEPHPDQDLVALDGGVEPAHQPFNGVHIIVQDVGAPGCGIKPVHVLLQAFHPSRCWTAGATRSCTGRDGSQQCSNSVGRDQEASNCSTCCAGDEADARPTRCTPQQPAPSPGLQEAEVKMGFEASKASMHALEAGCVGQERVGHLIEQVEGVKRAVALCRGESRRVRYQREDVRDGTVQRPRAMQCPAEGQAEQRRVVRGAEVVRGEAGQLGVGRVPQRTFHHWVLR